MAIEEDEALLTVAQVARWLNMHEETVRRLLAEGRLTGFQPGQRTWRISRGDVEGFIEAGKKRAVGRPKKESPDNAESKEK
jgi:excisionase family DNA binding protein